MSKDAEIPPVSRSWELTGQEVSELTPTDGDVWLVRRWTSWHLWNLDDRTYLRLPGQQAEPFPYDDGPQRITRVEQWPRVGEQSVVWFDDPYRPAFTEHYRVSAGITSIRRLAKPDPPG